MICLEGKDIVALIQALVWPIVALVALVYFREPLRKLAAELPRRASKITVFDFSIELAKVPQMSANWSAGNVDVRRLTPANMFDSNTSDLIKQISGSGTAEYAVIELGKGQEWLTSRLFLIADLLDRMRSLDCLVFVETRNTPRPVFVGMAHPKTVRWCLARSYPLFDTASVQAYALTYAGFGQPPAIPYRATILSCRGALDVNDAANYLRSFLNLIQQNTPAIPPGVPHDPPPSGWVDLEGSNIREYAQWISPQRLDADLSEGLSTASFEDSPDLSNRERVEGILRRTGKYVALVDRHNYFQGLVDREFLMEKVTTTAVQVKDENSENSN
jgi:hypothetical protein